jgi:hypothetical protein
VGCFSPCKMTPVSPHLTPTAPSYVTIITQPQQSEARQMVQLTLTNVDWAQKNKRNLDTMTSLSDSDDERGDKEDRYEHDDEGSLYAESTGDATEAARMCRRRQHRQQDKEDHCCCCCKTSRLESPWG